MSRQLERLTLAEQHALLLADELRAAHSAATGAEEILLLEMIESTTKNAKLIGRLAEYERAKQ